MHGQQHIKTRYKMFVFPLSLQIPKYLKYIHMKTYAQAFAACVQHTAFIAPGDLNPKAYPAKT